MIGSLPRQPTFLAVRPELPSLRLLPADAEPALRTALGEGALYALWANGAALPGKFVLRQNGWQMFVKIVEDEHLVPLQVGDVIASEAQSRGAAAVANVEGFPKRLDEGRWLAAYPYVDHRFARQDEADLEALGRELARLHRALRDVPISTTVRRLTEERFDALHEITARVRQDGAPHGASATVAEILTGGDWDLAHLLDGRPQVVHGDLNYANVLYEVPEGNVRFIDFETAARSWMIPYCDIAQVADRFVAVDDLAGQESLLGALVRGYREVDPAFVYDRNLMQRTLRTLCVRSLLLLCGRRLAGLPVPEAEWAKFFGAYSRNARG